VLGVGYNDRLLNVIWDDWLLNVRLDYRCLDWLNGYWISSSSSSPSCSYHDLWWGVTLPRLPSLWGTGIDGASGLTTGAPISPIPGKYRPLSAYLAMLSWVILQQALNANSSMSFSPCRRLGSAIF